MHSRGVSRILAVLGLLLALTILQVQPPASAQGFADLVAALKPAVVFVAANKPDGSMVSGSGFLIHPDGYILTAQHVISGAQSTLVRLASGIVQEAALVGSLEETDSALLKIPGSNYPVIRLGDSSKLRQGEEVLVFGYPGGQRLGVEDVTVTRGIVSAFRLNGLLIQIDAAINPGNSGGPVVATADAVAMGIAFATSPRFTGVNFAVSVLGAGSLLSKIPGGPPFASQPPAALPSPPPPELTGNWQGVWASSRVSVGGAFIASLSQSGSSVSGTAAMNGSPCFEAFQVSGTASGGSFSFTASAGGRERAVVSGTFSASTISGAYTTLASGTRCDGDRGTVNATRR